MVSFRLSAVVIAGIAASASILDLGQAQAAQRNVVPTYRAPVYRPPVVRPQVYRPPVYRPPARTHTNRATHRPPARVQNSRPRPATKSPSTQPQMRAQKRPAGATIPKVSQKTTAPTAAPAFKTQASDGAPAIREDYCAKHGCSTPGGSPSTTAPQQPNASARQATAPRYVPAPPSRPPIKVVRNDNTDRITAALAEFMVEMAAINARPSGGGGTGLSAPANASRPKPPAQADADYCDSSTAKAEADRMRGYVELIRGASEQAETLQRRYRALRLPVPPALTAFLNAVARARNHPVVGAITVSAELVDAAGRMHQAMLDEEKARTTCDPNSDTSFVCEAQLAHGRMGLAKDFLFNWNNKKSFLRHVSEIPKAMLTGRRCNP